MKTLLKVVVVSCVFLSLTGCGVQGHWAMQSVNPDTAKDKFQMQCLMLNADGSYMACVKEGAQAKCLKGEYKYDAEAKKLTFVTDGKERAYNAELVAGGNEMKFWGGEKGSEWTATMKRCGACRKDCGYRCCAPGCDPKACQATCAKAAEEKKEPAKKPEPAKKAEPAKPEAKKPEAKKPEAKKPEPAKKPAEAPAKDVK